MKVLLAALAFVGTSALACPYGDVKDAQAPAAQDKPMAAAKAPTAATPAKSVVATKKAADATKVVADKSVVETRKASPL